MNSPTRNERDEYSEFLLYANLDSYVARGRELIQKLKSAVSVLSRPDENGRFKDSREEQLYAQKEEVESEFACEFSRQREYLSAIEEELRLQNEYLITENRIHDQESKVSYDSKTRSGGNLPHSVRSSDEKLPHCR